jgi:diacylglycerol kinase (ATP)
VTGRFRHRLPHWLSGSRAKPPADERRPAAGDAAGETLSDADLQDDPFPSRGHGLLESFNWAIAGLVWTLRHQRNMRIHFAIAVVVIVAALVFSVTRVELLLVFAAITFVFVAEMLNTAVEYTVDLITSAKHPAARIAKDVAAGAVFVAALNALAVAYLVFYDRVVDIPYSILHRLRISEVDLTVVALVLVGLLVIVFKAAVGRGSALRGGWPSGHAAIAFGGWTAVTFIATRTPYAIPISFVVLIMAFLTAQSRVQAHIHTWLEVAAGALLGVVVTAGVFFIWRPF